MPAEADTHRIVFTPSGRRGAVAAGTSVLDAARDLGVDLDSVCGGRGLCGRCQVVPVFGEFPKLSITSSPEALPDVTADEMRYARRRGLADDRRLGCKIAVRADVVVEVPPDSQVHRQVVRKRLEVHDFTVDPVVRLHYVRLPPARLDAPSGDVQRLLSSLRDEWSLADLHVTPAAVGRVQAASAAGDGDVTVAVRDGTTVVWAWEGFHDIALGVAVDVGSTTIAGHLCDLSSGRTLASAGVMNPQVRFGEDLMSRVSYVMMNDDGADRLTGAVRSALADLIIDLCERAESEPDDILELTLAGNPIMHHLALGFDVRPLGESPFSVATTEPIDVPATDLGLRVNPAARVHALPLIAGHVGGDTAGAILSEAPHRSKDLQLLVDVGTNAEIVLGNDHRLLAASSPTGPAFEGAQISDGQRATPGAIERVRIDPDTLEPRFRVVGCDLWSDDDGFADAVDDPGGTGICGSGIVEAVAELYLTGLVAPDGTFADDAADRTGRVVPDGRTFAYRLSDSVTVTQNDVRAIQLAKAALAAGTRILMHRFGAQAVDEIRLAGAFGSHLDPRYAMVLGLIPDCDLDRVSAAGNAAGAGAVMALLDRAGRAEIAEVTRSIERVETATEPTFQDHFVACMAFPHDSDPYANLSRVVELPRATHGRRTRRRSRRSVGSGT